MSLFNRHISLVKGAVLCVVPGLVLAACTMQPLYSGRSENGRPALNVSSQMRAALASIAIDEPKDHIDQMVRNRLIFLLGDGQGQPANPSYSLALNVRARTEAAVQVDIGDTTDRAGRASVGTVVATSAYVLKDGDGKAVITRTRTVRASFDRPRQEYANLQAEKDAQKRAAEELAEWIYLSLAQDFTRR